MDLEIKKATIKDLDNTWGIIKICSDWLVEQGMNHWESYYSKKLIAKKIKTQQVFLAYVDKKPIATITLDKNPVSYYEEKDLQKFADPGAKAYYMMALAVIPGYQKRGIAGQLIKFAEKKALKEGIKYTRFDCRASYQELVEYYKKRDYKVAGDFIDPDDNSEIYLLMEKNLKSS